MKPGRMSSLASWFGHRIADPSKKPLTTRRPGESTSSWQAIDIAEATGWLAPQDGIAGFDKEGWEASIWIAHAMYELPGHDNDLTHDDVRRSRIAAGLDSPHIVGEINLEDFGVVTGGQLGLTQRPSPEWQRVRWDELAARMGVGFEKQTVPPCFRWFPYSSWPAAIEPPCEGSLDEDSTRALIPHLLAASPGDECTAIYGGLAVGFRPDAGQAFGGPISDLLGLAERSEHRIGTPSNIWPSDRSWFVYTDWDLWGTKVSGPRWLIDRLIADPELETLVWVAPSTPAA